MTVQPTPPDASTIERLEAARARHAVTALAPLGGDAEHNRLALTDLLQSVTRSVSQFAEPRAVACLARRLQAAAAGIQPLRRPGCWFVATDGVEHQALVLPEPFDAIVFHGRRYYVRPLIQAAATHGEFLLLAMSLSSVQLFRLSGEDMERQNVPDLPAALGDVAGNRFNGGSPQHSAAGDPRVERYLEAVSSALCDDIGLREQYVMIAAEEQLAEWFRQISEHPHLLPPAVSLSPDQASPEALQRAAQDSYEDWRRHSTRQFLDDLAEGPDRATSDPEQVLKAAREGRVDTLVAPRKGHLWGRFHAAEPRLELHGSRQPDSRDLVDTAMRAAWRHGGRIRIVDSNEPASPLQARLRD